MKKLAAFFSELPIKAVPFIALFLSKNLKLFVNF